MTSRERLLVALAGGCPDRVPISTYELVGFNSASFENCDPSYARLMQAIRERTDCVCTWDPSSNACLPRNDQIGDFLETTSHPVEMDTWTSVNGRKTTTSRLLHTPAGDLARTSEVFRGVHTVWKTEHWCKSPGDVDKLLSIPFRPVDYDFSDYSRIRSAEEAVADVIGAELIWIGLPDACLVYSEDCRLKLVDAIRQAKPDVMLVSSPGDYHPDHVSAGRLAADASLLVTLALIETAHPPV